MKNKYTVLLIVLSLIFLLGSCDLATIPVDQGNPGGGATPTGGGAITTLDIITISEDINTDQTWVKGKIYYIDYDSFIGINAVLTIEPGCIVKFGWNSGFYIKTGGKILARGNNADKIFFTSYRDDIGGKLPDFPLSPERSDWIKMSFQESGSVFEFCQFEYGSNPIEVAYVNSTIIIKDCLFRNNDWALKASKNPSGLSVFERNQFYSNRYPLVIHPVQVFAASNKFTSDDGSLINDNQTIELSNSSMVPYFIIQTDITLIKINAIDYKLRSFTLDEGVTCTLEDSVIVKIPHDGLWHLSKGASVVLGADCYLTSTEDDSIGVNIDGEAPYGPIGNTFNWDGIHNDFTNTYVKDSRFKYSDNSSIP